MKETLKIECSLPETHNRLNQTFVLFQNIKNNYHEELEFTSDLNNIIQALRNVTFVIYVYQCLFTHQTGLVKMNTP